MSGWVKRRAGWLAGQSMESVLKRREELRREMRRQQIAGHMSTIRQDLMDASALRFFHHDLCTLLTGQESLTEVVAFMRDHLAHTQHPQLPSMSQVAAECLLSSWRSFTQEENVPGLAELVAAVVTHSEEEWRVSLSLPCYISCLFSRLLELWREGAQEGGQLFQVCCCLSLHAAKQSKREHCIEEELIYHLAKATNSGDKITYQLLLLALMATPQKLFRQSTKNQLAALARRIFVQIKEGNCLEEMHHILLLEIGYHCSYGEGDEEIVSYLLYCFDQKRIDLTLRFLNEQIVKQDWVMYQHIADFMLKCRRRMRAEGSALLDFLRILSNVLINEFNCPAVAEQIYLQLFHSQMHHFLYPHLLLELAFLLCKLINIKSHLYRDEFAHIALRCLQMGSNRLHRAEKFKLLCFLMYYNEITESELGDFCSKSEIQDFWVIYEALNQEREL